MKKIKVVYIISLVNKALEFEWVAEQLDRERFELSFILLNSQDTALEQKIKAEGLRVKRIHFTGKKDLPKACWQIFWLLLRWRPAIVHAHLFEASLAGLIAAKLAGIRHRIYTRHHATIHHNYHPQVVRYDLLNNRLATHIIAISTVVKEVLVELEGVPAQKITTIHHGLDTESFLSVSEERVARLKAKYNAEGKSPVIGAISRYTHWKGLHFTIEAFAQVHKQYPDALLVLANAKGDYAAEIQALLGKLPRESYVEITFEADIQALYRLFDVFVHVPVDATSEAFGQIYIEAPVCRVPMVVTLSGIAHDIAQPDENCVVVPYQNAAAIEEGVLRILQNADFALKLADNAQKTVVEHFTASKKIASLARLYLTLTK